MKKSIIIISHLNVWSMGRSKGAQSLWLTIKGYSDAGYNTYFITSNKKMSNNEVQYPNLKIIRFNATFIECFLKYKKIGFIFKIIFWIYFQSKAYIIGFKTAKKYENIVFYGYEVYGIPVAKILSFVFKMPMISRFQGTILMPKTKTKFWRTRYWQHVLAMKIPADLILMTNDGTQGDRILQLLNKSVRNVEFLMNGVEVNSKIDNIDIDKAKTDLNIHCEHKILLTISRLVNWKRLDRIITAMPSILKENKNITLLIVGDGQEKENLIKQVQIAQINNNVKFVGSISHKELYKFYGIADIFISFYDLSNVGNPLLEAMTYGKCIITLNNGDTNKLIRNNYNGILLNIDEIVNIPKIILDLLEDNSKILNLGKHSKLTAQHKFWSWDQRIEYEISKVDKILELYATN